MTQEEELNNRRVVDRAEMMRDILHLEKSVRILIHWKYEGTGTHLRAIIWELKRRAEELLIPIRC